MYGLDTFREWFKGYKVEIFPESSFGEFSLPLYLDKNYFKSLIKVNDTKLILAEYKYNDINLKSKVTQIKRLEELTNLKSVLILESLTQNQVDILLKNGINFISKSGNIHIPDLRFNRINIIEEEKHTFKKLNNELKLKVEVQVFLIYLILKKLKNIDLIETSLKLGYPIETILKYIEFLNSKGFKLNVTENNFVTSELSQKEFCKLAFEYLKSPVKGIFYITKSDIPMGLQKSGYTALHRVSSLGKSYDSYVAGYGLEELKEKSVPEQYSNEDFVTVEEWFYDPRLLSDCDFVDNVSLVLSLFNNSVKEPRVGLAIGKVMNLILKD